MLTDNPSTQTLAAPSDYCSSLWKGLGVSNPHFWGWLSLQPPKLLLVHLSGWAKVSSAWKLRHIGESEQSFISAIQTNPCYNIYLSFATSETEVAVLIFVHKYQLQVWFLSALPFWKIFRFFPHRWRCHLVMKKKCKEATARASSRWQTEPHYF